MVLNAPEWFHHRVLEAEMVVIVSCMPYLTLYSEQMEVSNLTPQTHRAQGKDD